MSKRIRSVITRKKAQNTLSHKNINYGEIVIEFVAFINHFDFTNFEINYILKFEYRLAILSYNDYEWYNFLPNMPSMLWFVLCSSPSPRSVFPPLKTLEILDTLGALFLSQMESSNKVLKERMKYDFLCHFEVCKNINQRLIMNWFAKHTCISFSRISQLNIPGLSFLYSSIFFSTSGVATRGFEPPITPGRMEPVS